MITTTATTSGLIAPHKSSMRWKIGATLISLVCLRLCLQKVTWSQLTFNVDDDEVVAAAGGTNYNPEAKKNEPIANIQRVNSKNQTSPSKIVPGSVTIPHIQELRKEKLDLSLKRQESFFTKKDKVVLWLNDHANTKKRQLLDFGGVSCDLCFAVVLNKRYAFRHVFKTGGTAVEEQANRKQVGESKCGDRLLLATVRDPIDHFLSGWAECGSRRKIPPRIDDVDAKYDDRVFSWLGHAERHQHFPHNSKTRYKCVNHSFPQANYLLQEKRKRHGTSSYFHPKLDLVGDMDELPQLLKLVGFEFNRTIGTAKGEISNQQMENKYPRNKSLLSNRTIGALCSYLALDYYMFNFEPPSRCRNQIETDIASITAQTA